MIDVVDGLLGTIRTGGNSRIDIFIGVSEVSGAGEYCRDAGDVHKQGGFPV